MKSKFIIVGSMGLLFGLFLLIDNDRSESTGTEAEKMGSSSVISPQSDRQVDPNRSDISTDPSGGIRQEAVRTDADRDSRVEGESEEASMQNSSASPTPPAGHEHGSVFGEDSVKTSSDSVKNPLQDSPRARGWYESRLREGVKVLNHYSLPESDDRSNPVTYIQTDLKHPWIRVERREIKVQGEFVEHWDASAGTHLILRTRPDVSEEDLRSALQTVSMRIHQTLKMPHLYLVGVDVVEGKDVLADAERRLSGLDTIVQSLERDSLVATTALPETQPALLEGRQWPLRNLGEQGGRTGSDIDAVPGWSIRGDADGVVVAVIDTGIDYLHEDLVNNIWHNSDEIPDNGLDDDGNGYVDDVHGIDSVHNDSDPADDHGHGTHVAGIIGADGFNEVGMTGVAPRVQLMGLKFLSQTGLGFTSDALEVIQYAKDNGADILNMSWGNRTYSEALFLLLQECDAAGILLVASAGNDGENIDNRPVYPASFTLSRLQTVASVDDVDVMSGFSNYGGLSVEIAAPGTHVFSTWLSEEEPYRTLSGTSMAAPHVAGTLAILRAQFPEDSTDQILARLHRGSESLPGLVDRVQRGRRLNLAGALQSLPTPEHDTETGAFASSLHTAVWTGSNRSASTEAGDENRVQSVWYKWNPPVGGGALIQFDAPEGLWFDVLPSGTGTGIPLLERRGSGRFGCAVQEGNPVSIVVYGAPGEFQLRMSVPPVNDDQDRASRAHGYRWSVNGSSLGATKEIGEVGVGFGDEHSVWWKWTAPASGAVRMDTAGSDFDTMLSVFKENPLDGLVMGDHPDLIFIVDVSGSVQSRFVGEFLSDRNLDGFSNTILDAEITAISNLITYLNRSEAAYTNTVRIIVFEHSARALDLNPVAPGNQTGVPSTSDENGNGIPDAVEALEHLRAGGATNFRAALQLAEAEFSGSEADATPNVIFFSDGKPTTGGSYTEVVQRLRDAGTFLQAFGVGRSASLGSLIQIDPSARIFSSEEELIQMISGALAFNDDTSGQLSSEVNLAVEAGKTY